MSITLEDVETAIKILRRYLKLSNEARILLKRLGMSEGRSTFNPFDLESIMRYLYQTRTGVKEERVDDEEGVSEEELNHIREIAKKIREKEIEKTNTK